MHRHLLATGHVHHRHRSMASVASVSGTTTARMVDFSSGNGALAIIDFYGAAGTANGFSGIFFEASTSTE